MKKYIIITIVVLLSIFLVICIKKIDNVPKYDKSIFSNCTLLEKNERHALYQCPTDTEWIINIKQNKPNGNFTPIRETTKKNAYLIFSDTKHEYVEIVFNDNKCPENYSIRTRLKIPTPLEKWAFISCK